MKNLMPASFALLALVASVPLASGSADVDVAAPALPGSFEAFDCATLAEGLCDAIAMSMAEIDPADALLLALYQDVYPNGQFGNFDCVYDRASNTSVIVERWSVHVEAGTLNGSTRNPIVNTNVYYPFVDTASGNVC